MKITEMNYIRDSRENIVGFLNVVDIVKIEKLTNNRVGSNYYDSCNLIINAYESGSITNAAASKSLAILRDNNPNLRKESHRIGADHSIYEYCPNADAYVFLKKGTLREFNQLNRYL